MGCQLEVTVELGKVLCCFDDRKARTFGGWHGVHLPVLLWTVACVFGVEQKLVLFAIGVTIAEVVLLSEVNKVEDVRVLELDALGEEGLCVLLLGGGIEAEKVGLYELVGQLMAEEGR